MSDETNRRFMQIRATAEAWTRNYDAGIPTGSGLDTRCLIADLLSLVNSQAIEDGCGQCGSPHDFDTSIPSVVWNQVIRARGLSDYLCMTCIVREFVRVGQGFTAELWNEEFNGVPIELIVNGQNAKDAALVQEENNSLRNQINDAAQSIVNEADKVAQLMQAAATRMRDKCLERVREYFKYSPATCEALINELERLTPDQELSHVQGTSQATHEIKSSTLTPDGIARPKIS